VKIRIINPVVTRSWEQETQEAYSSLARSGVQIDTVSLDWGPASIETRRDNALATPDILNKTIQAEREGFGAVIIDCMDDPGLFAAREVVRIPVVGPAEASVHLAAILGHRFSMISVLDIDRVTIEEMVERYGLSARLASVRTIGIPVLDLSANSEQVFQSMLETSEKAVREDGADVLIPGCNLLASLAPRIQAHLKSLGLAAIFLNPRAVALKLAETLVELGLAQSQLSFAPANAKDVSWPVRTAFA